MKKKLAVLAAAAFTAGILLSGCGGSKGGDTKSSSAAWKPEKDVKIIVAYKAGSGTDTGARLLANSAKKYVGQTLVIETNLGLTENRLDGTRQGQTGRIHLRIHQSADLHHARFPERRGL